MLEEDMDVLELPDRHSLMFNEAGSNFSASPVHGQWGHALR
jgi:hypothetical protein